MVGTSEESGLAESGVPGSGTAGSRAAGSWSTGFGPVGARPTEAGPLGAQLRDAREAAGIGLRRLALKLNTSHATLSRWESGARRPGPQDVAAYLDHVGVPEPRRDELVELAARPEGATTSRCSDERAALLAIEREATRITSVSSLLVPDLLQTADYARAVLVASGADQSEVDLDVAVRIGRREVVAAKEIPIRVFLAEHVLRQRIGGAEVMLGQVRVLRDACQAPTVDLRVVPDGLDWHPGLDGPFWIGERDAAPAVVRLESRVSARFLREPEQVASYARAVQQVADVALGPDCSSRHIDAALIELQHEVRQEGVSTG